MHVDEFIDGHSEDAREPSVKYARWFFHLHRLSAGLFYDFQQWLNPYQLYCTYKGKQYRVTGASTMGDIWLVEDFSQDSGYKYRVDLEDCSDWKDKPDLRQEEI